jgi:hypothetical protein
VINGFNQKVHGDQSTVSMFESRYPLISSLNPLGQPFYTLLIQGLFLYLFFNHSSN